MELERPARPKAPHHAPSREQKRDAVRMVMKRTLYAETTYTNTRDDASRDVRAHESRRPGLYEAKFLSPAPTWTEDS